jgi:glycosyltransferase involved in cell wall biosynthesis
MAARLENVSLITTVYNESDSIVRFLDSYQRQSAWADEFIVVDGGSTDGTPTVIDEYQGRHPELRIRLVSDPTCSKRHSRGPIARGRNVAIAEARHEIIAVTDAGCLLNERWLEEIVQPFAAGAVDVVAGWYEPTLENSFQERYARIFLPSLDTLDKENFLPSSRSLAFRKEAWAKVGGYPEDTYTAEDTAFDISLKSSGCRFAFNDRAVVYWSCPKTLDEACKKHYLYGFGDGQYRLFKEIYGKIMLGLLFPCKYLLRRKYRQVGTMAYLINASLVKGYLKGFVTGIERSR